MRTCFFDNEFLCSKNSFHIVSIKNNLRMSGKYICYIKLHEYFFVVKFNLQNKHFTQNLKILLSITSKKKTNVLIRFWEI